jgi:hypothetical protein
MNKPLDIEVPRRFEQSCCPIRNLSATTSEEIMACVITRTAQEVIQHCKNKLLQDISGDS